MLARLLLEHSAGFALVVCRLAGFVVSSPFPGAHASSRQRVGLVVVLSWLAAGIAPMGGAPPTLSLGVVLPAAFELGCGLAIGITFRLIFFAGETLGQVISQSIGLSSPSVLNPTIENEDMVMARVVTLLAMLLALAVGAHRIALGYVLESFRSIPIGQFTPSSEVAGVLIDLAIASFSEGIRMGLPFVGLTLAVQLALAMISRAAPALQIFSVGLGVLLATGFATLLVSMRELGAAVLTYYSHLPAHLDQVTSAFVGKGS